MLAGRYLRGSGKLSPIAPIIVTISFLVHLAVCDGLGNNGTSASSLQSTLGRKISGASDKQLNRYRTIAATKLKADLIKALRAMAGAKSVPGPVRNAARRVIGGLRAGRFNALLKNSIPVILRRTSRLNKGKTVVATQLSIVLGQMANGASNDLRRPTQALLQFVNNNLDNVSRLLGSVVGISSDLLQGTVRSLAAALGALSNTAGNALNSLGTLLASLLGG